MSSSHRLHDLLLLLPLQKSRSCHIKSHHQLSETNNHNNNNNNKNNNTEQNNQESHLEHINHLEQQQYQHIQNQQQLILWFIVLPLLISTRPQQKTASNLIKLPSARPAKTFATIKVVESKEAEAEPAFGVQLAKKETTKATTTTSTTRRRTCSTLLNTHKSAALFTSIAYLEGQQQLQQNITLKEDIPTSSHSVNTTRGLKLLAYLVVLNLYTGFPCGSSKGRGFHFIESLDFCRYLELIPSQGSSAASPPTRKTKKEAFITKLLTNSPKTHKLSPKLPHKGYCIQQQHSQPQQHQQLHKPNHHYYHHLQYSHPEKSNIQHFLHCPHNHHQLRFLRYTLEG